MPCGSGEGERGDLAEVERAPGGALFIVSHLGNVDLARALLDDATRQMLLVLVHTRHAENYNQLLRRYRPAAAVNTWQVTDLGRRGHGCPESAGRAEPFPGW